MSFDADDEILQDFLIEAGEIIDTLNEELIELEQRPNDSDLLNSVFRSFHTIKGGAGFLALNSLVELCHRAEDVFNLLRNGELEVSAAIMDVMLPVLDSLNEMFDSLRAATEPEPADPALLGALDSILNGDIGAAEPSAVQEPSVADQEPSAGEQLPAGGQASADVEFFTDSNASPDVEFFTDDPATSATAENSEDVTDEEFEQLLDALDGGEGTENTSQIDSSTPSDEISENEFEDLLDQLHGKGKFDANNSNVANSPPASTTNQQPDAPASDDITDDEFENLLDDLHGPGQFGNVNGAGKPAEKQPPAVEPAANAAPKVEKKVEPEPKPKPKPEPEVIPAAKKAPPPPKKSKDSASSGGVPAPIPAEATVRVDTKRLDDIMNMVGELVLVRNRLVTLEQSLGSEEMSKAVSSLDVVTADLQMSVMKTRMQPIKKVFGRFPRVVRDLSRTMKKQVNLELIGEDTDLDKNLVEALADPLVHLVRNSVDHGVEMPDVRLASGKTAQGTVVLTAEQEGDHIMLSIEDDGAGMNADVLRKKVVEKGLMDTDAADRLDDKECYNLIFMPGFSTKDEISDISGRGVGMDVVKTRIAQLNGSIDIDSEEGAGTRIAIKVPLTLAIMPTLMVKLKDQAFALPLVSVNEIFHLDLTKTNTVDGHLVIMVRGKPLPLFYLTRWLVKGCEYEELPSEGHVVVVHVGTKKVGFVVNHLIGQEEVVIKPLGSLLQGTDGLAGATITGDGKIALILDIPTLMSSRAH